MSRRSVASTPLSPDDLPDLPDIGEHSEESSDSVRAAAVTSSYSEICLSAEDELNDDLLPSEIQDLNLVQDTTEEITRLVDEINRGDDDNDRQLSNSRLSEIIDRKNRHVPTSLRINEPKVLPTFEAAFGLEREALQRQVKDETDEEVIETKKITELGGVHEKPVVNTQGSQNTRSEGQALIANKHKIDGQHTYVADDINDLIRQASRTTSLAPTPAPDVSRLPIILAEFEEDARRLANSVQHMMENLSSQLHNVTRLTGEYIATYESGVMRTCDAADANVKSMYRLLAKYEELGKAMQPVHRIANEVRTARQLVGQLEALLEVKKHKPT
ncbi:uncharacterized protein LOC111266044 [Varroa jacobsoni]|uniref:uncharacterized protein LOC111266044 n=1 Tax=Varroa jacobsoni TaxID=62625 RepID=UPI000BF33D4B|nr:uncharacterized protein LOC111266044 [Varroa jacobsoni]